ncbi:hypothetical protein HY480_02130 [Candidatus Uhrbacteria bacterium]|nr:hypothetical protein [Candidatus Uhrbacteria bacterium]
MTMFFAALVTAILGVVPLLISRRVMGATVFGIVAFLVSWWAFYAFTPTLVWPLCGDVGVMVLFCWIVAAIVDGVLADHPTHAVWFPAVMTLLFIGRGCAGCDAFHARDYADLIGPVDERVWTQDVQPKDPKHVRLVPHELAMYLAGKQLGDADGAIGSRFHLSPEHATLQVVGGELWHVIPLDYRGFSVWQSADYAPGYVMVHGEDPLHPVSVVTDQRFVYTPGAYFHTNLERHLRNNGYLFKGLTEYSLELDDQGKPWWVVTVFEPTVQWWGEKATGVVVVDPTTGAHAFHALGSVPAWVDRVIPGAFIQQYLTDHGALSSGWVNSWWGKLNLTEPETLLIAYGADEEPYWVTSITSTNPNDESLLQLVYVSSRTGKAVSYRASGGTETAVMEAVNNVVRYKNLYATPPVLYNIAGTMAAIVPILGASHTFQGVGIVRVDTMKAAIGDDIHAAYGEYLRLLAKPGQEVVPEAARDRVELVGIVARFARDDGSEETSYLLLITGTPHVFTGAGTLSRELPLTQVGDEVALMYVSTGQDIEPMLSFDNRAIVLERTAAQSAAGQRAEKRLDVATIRAREDDVREEALRSREEKTTDRVEAGRDHGLR